MPLSNEYLFEERTKMRGVRFVLEKDVKHMRAAMAASEAATEAELPEPSDNVDVEHLVVENWDLVLEIFSPIQEVASARPLPIMLYYFGGGLVLKGREWPLLERICEEGQFIVVFPHYRLAPEHPWPSGLDDSFTAYEWAHDNATTLGGDPDAIFVAGPSAGGLLAFDVAYRVLSNATLRGSLRGILALVPATVHEDGVPPQYASIYESYARHPDRWENTVAINRESLRTMWEAAKIPSLDDPAIWPLHAALRRDVRFPAVVFVLAGCDPLYGDGRLMAKALEDAGTPVKMLIYPEMFHNL